MKACMLCTWYFGYLLKPAYASIVKNYSLLLT